MAKENKKAERRERKAAQRAAIEREEDREEMEYIAFESFQIDPERYMD